MRAPDQRAELFVEPGGGFVVRGELTLDKAPGMADELPRYREILRYVEHRDGRVQYAMGSLHYPIADAELEDQWLRAGWGDLVCTSYS